MAVKQFLSDETIFYTDDVDGSFGDKVLATANAVASGIVDGNVLTLELTAVEDGFDIGASFNDLKKAFLSGKKIITHLEFDEEGTVGDTWSNLDIIELLESDMDGTPAYFINLTFYVNSAEFVFTDNVEDPTADIVVTSSV